MSSESERAWIRFDELIAAAGTSSPWVHDQGATARYEPDRRLLEDLLTVPLTLGLSTQSGATAKAIDTWVAHELRRSGFDPDEVWPRASVPRVLPYEVALLRDHPAVPKVVRDGLFARIDAGVVKKGVTSNDAYVLGKAYPKQVDVLIAQWSRGPELMISTKGMGSSFGKNVLNRIEESYGDAKNLRGRHPLAALGYLFVMRGTAFRTEAATTARLVDLLVKLAQESDVYDATALVAYEWIDGNGGRVDAETVVDPSSLRVVTDDAQVPADLRIDRFLTTMVDAVLARTPIDLHVEVRNRRQGNPLPIEEAATGALDEPPPSARTDEPLF